MSIKKIVVIIESIDVNDSSCTKCNVALIENLVQCGYDVVVYHYTRRDAILKGIKCISIKERKFNINYLLSRTQRVIQRTFNIHLHVFFEKIFGFSFTYFNDLKSIKSIIPEVKKHNPDLIITLSKGTSFRPHHALLSFPELNTIWLANIHDPYPFHFNPRPYNWVEPGYEKKEKFFREISKNARYSSFPSLLLKEWMGSYFPNFLKTGIIIPHQNADYKINDVALPDYFDKTKFNLLHAGSLMPTRSPYGLLEGFLLFLKNNPQAKANSKLILLGKAHFTEMLKDYNEKWNEIHVHNDYVPFDLVYKLQMNVSANIILESKSEISPFLPGKFPHCIEANKPIISLAPYYSEVKRLLGVDYHYWSEVDDVTKIAQIIEKLYHIWLDTPEKLNLDRNDLIDYLSANHLKKVIDDL
jgi:hypothetical protein